MSNFSEKPYRNAYNNRPPKQYASKKWDHNGYDELQHEQGPRYKNDERHDRYKKNRKYQNDVTMASDLLDKQDQADKHDISKDKWAHDKYDANTEKAQAEPVSKVDNEREKTQKPARKERRPDKQLYSVRDKRHNDESKPRNINQENNKHGKLENQDREKIAIVKEEGLKLPKSIGKGAYVNEDDTKSTISNVSTAISDPLKGYEEETSILRESKGEILPKKAEEKNEESKMELSEPDAFFEIVLDTGKIELFRISENEEDYEGLLDSICESHGLGKRMSLYFKIYILKALQDVHTDAEKIDAIEAILDRLLDINMKLIMVENGVESVDEVTLPYMDDEESMFLETPPGEAEEEV